MSRENFYRREQRVNNFLFRRRAVKESVLMVGLFALSAYIVYFTPFNVSKIFFLVLLFLFLLSKRDYFWFAYFFIIAQGPGYFFADFSGASLYRLPLYKFLVGMSFTPLDLFVFLALIKGIMKGRKLRLKLGRPLILLLIYAIVSVLLSSFLYGTNEDLVSWHLRWMFAYSIIVSFTLLVFRESDVYHFMSLVFPFVFFIIFTQIFFLVTGNEFINNFSPEFRGVALNTVTGELRPVMGGVLILFFSYIFSMFLALDDSHRLPKNYLYFIMLTALLGVFLSATRIWFVIFSIVLVGYLVISRRKMHSLLTLLAISACVISLLNYSGLIPLDYITQSSWGRFKQLFAVVGEGVYAIDTARSRIVSLSIVLSAIKQNPLIGYGFSELTWEYYTNDLGFLNTIVVFGLAGFSLLIYFFVKCFEMLITSIRKSTVCSSTYTVLLKMMVVTWISILVGYLLTWDFFALYFYKVFFISIIIVVAEFMARQAQPDALPLR